MLHQTTPSTMTSLPPISAPGKKQLRCLSRKRRTPNGIGTKPLSTVNDVYIDQHWDEISKTFCSRVSEGAVYIRGVPDNQYIAGFRVTKIEQKRIMCSTNDISEDFLVCRIVVAVEIEVCRCDMEKVTQTFWPSQQPFPDLSYCTLSDWYAIDASFYFENASVHMEYCGEQIYSKYVRNEKDCLDENFIPIIMKGTHDAEANKILKDYYPEALEKAVPVEGKVLAERLGLKIVYAHLSKDKSVLGLLYFKKGIVSVYEKETDSYHEMQVEGDTIVLDKMAINASQGATESGVIIHECVHKLKHSWFQWLQYTVDENWVSMPCMAEGQEGYLPGQEAMRDIEIQTRALTVRIQLPKQTLLPETRKHLNNCGIDPRNRSDRAYAFEQIIGTLQKQYGDVTKQSIKKRLADIGDYDELYGVLNYVNKEYSPVHIYPKGACSKDQTWTLNLNTLLAVYKSDKRFRECLQSGRYVYVEGHICLNKPEYVVEGLEGAPVMTRYGREHINECCLLFENRYSYEKEKYYRDGILHNDAFKRKKSTYMANKTDDEVIKSGMELLMHAQDTFAFHMSMPLDFGKALDSLQEKYDMSNSLLADSIGVSENTVMNWKSGRSKISKPHCVSVCIALQLDQSESKALLMRANHSLGLDEDDLLYSIILETCYTRTVATVNDMLKSAGKKPLSNATNQSERACM